MDTANDPNGMAAALSVDYDTITALFRQADEQGRDYLFEYETYDLLKNSGAETPPRDPPAGQGLQAVGRGADGHPRRQGGVENRFAPPSFTKPKSAALRWWKSARIKFVRPGAE